MEQIVSGIASFVLLLAGGAAVRSAIKRNGTEEEKRESAEETLDEVLEREEQGNAADLTDDQYDDFMDRL